MRILLFLAICSIALLDSGCVSPSQSRADYVRATLPYDSIGLVKTANRLRRAYPESKLVALLDEKILEDFLRLHICLDDPWIREADKRYARDVWSQVFAYCVEHDIAFGYERGREYNMLPDDLVLPAKMRIHDVVDEILAQKTTPTNRLQRTSP